MGKRLKSQSLKQNLKKYQIKMAKTVKAPKTPILNKEGMRKYKNYNNMYMDRVIYDDEPYRLSAKKGKNKTHSAFPDGIVTQGKTKGKKV
mgnify:CR=1 FL=1